MNNYLHKIAKDIVDKAEKHKAIIAIGRSSSLNTERQSQKLFICENCGF